MDDSSKNKNSFKKYLPLVFLVIITIALMFYFKENKGSIGEIVDKSTDDIISLYTANLQPLLFGTDVTKEDVFNFALYQTLPIDKSKKDVLRLSEENDGSTSYQVVPASYRSNTNNYENFVKYMKFTANQKAELDSILESYQPELAEAVLTNDDNTVAVSSRLANLQKAVLTDIAAFSQSVNKPRMSDLFGGDYSMLDSKKALKIVNEVKQDTSKEFLVIAKDTAFTSRLDFNAKEIQKKLEQFKEKSADLQKAKINVKVSAENAIPPKPPKLTQLKKLQIDSGYSYTYVTPDFDYENFGYDKQAFDSLNVVLNELKNSLKSISFKVDLGSLSDSLHFDIDSNTDSSLKGLKLEMNMEGLGEIINKSIEAAMKHPQDEKYWEEFGEKMESLAVNMTKINEDSLKVQQLEERIKELKSKKKNK